MSVIQMRKPRLRNIECFIANQESLVKAQAKHCYSLCSFSSVTEN